MAACAVDLETRAEHDCFEGGRLVCSVEHGATDIGSRPLGFVGGKTRIRFPDTEVNDHMRVVVENDLRNGVGTIEGNATERRALQTSTRRVGINSQ